MGKNILIVPSNDISRTPNRTPYINFINNAGDVPIDIKVLTGATITFSSSTQANILVVRPADKVISVGNTLNVRGYMAFGATQVINSTLNWVGPTTNITGAQGAQGAQGNTGDSITPTNPVTTLTLTSAQNTNYSQAGTKFFNTYNLNGTGTATFTYTTPVFGGSYVGTLWGNPNSSATVGPLNRTSRWTNGGTSGPIDTWIGYSTCLTTTGGSKTYYVGIAADNDFRLRLNSVDIVNTLNGPLDNSDLAFKYWNVYAVTISGGANTLELYGLNRASVAAFGMEIYDNTLSQLTAATTTADLNIIYSSSARTTAEIVQNINGSYISSGYTCPTGYAWSPCGGGVNGVCIGYLGNTGAQGAQGATGAQGLTGATGAQGLTGATGAQGLTGATGAQGISGATGAQGTQGAVGPTGGQGNIGPTGAQGNTGTIGPQGSQGSVGAQGPTGGQGNIGPTGAQGNIGAQGNTGAIGNTGAQGATGAQGNVGAQGATGHAGAQGATGNTGAQGAAGQTGNTGAQGATGNTGAQGPAGQTGNTGAQGAMGAQGAQGQAGGTGHTGAQGSGGTTGAQGSQGQVGNRGAQGSGGATGAQGSQGAVGNTGAQGSGGATGAQGAQGQTGHFGAQGAVGTKGPQGQPGGTGNPGAQGAVGAQGSQGGGGQVGNPGAQGAVGASGNPGPVGAQGLTGAQGQPGNTGAQGAQGPATGTGAQGGPGPTGAQGNQGAQGPRAGQGAQGGPGGAGPQGAQGPGGPRGSQGPQGAQGAQSGVQGATGSPGATGAQGSQGAAGPPGGGGGQGFQGAAGPTPGAGPQGFQGAGGPPGGAGPQGAQGATGPAGVTCYQFTYYHSFAISDFCSNICDSTLMWQQFSFCNQYGNKYIDQTNCQNSSCDWMGNGYYYGACFCGSFYAFILNYTCGTVSTYTTCAYSDARLKHGIETLKDALKKIMEIDAVEYDWNEKLPSQVYEFYKRRQKLHTIGLIAQNVRLVYPEVVMMNNEGYYSINYEKLNAVLVEGIKEQSLFIEDIDKELNELESKLS